MTQPEAVPEFDLADRMRKALRTSGLTVQEMAEYLGVARNTVGKWINGHIPPSRQTLRLWGDADGGAVRVAPDRRKPPPAGR